MSTQRQCNADSSSSAGSASLLGSGLSALVPLSRQLQERINLPQTTQGVGAGLGITPRPSKLRMLRAKRLLCSQVPKTWTPPEHLGSRVRQRGRERSGISSQHLTCLLSPSAAAMPPEHAFDAWAQRGRERGAQRHPANPQLGGAGIWEPTLRLSRGGRGRQEGRYKMRYLFIYLLLQVGERHPQQVERPACVPAQGIGELRGAEDTHRRSHRCSAQTFRASSKIPS